MATKPSIIVGTDFSRGSERAISRGRMMAEQLDWRLVATHVVKSSHASPAERDVATEAALEELKRSVQGNGLMPTRLVCVGSPHEELVRAAEAEGAHVIVVGAHQSGHAIEQLLLGSTAERVVRSGHCAVLVARILPAQTHRVALVPVDLGETTPRLLALADELFRDAKLVVVHCLGSEDAHRSHHAAQERIDELTASLRLDPERCTVQIATASDPRRRILELAKQHEADVIALGTHARHGLKRMLIGSTAEYVVRHAACDVLVLPP
jgi:nucleotide-binding universal stress UspA family protein